jgi:hypothetical protein
MQGMMSNPTFQIKIPSESQKVSVLAYAIADAMLKQREL